MMGIRSIFLAVLILFLGIRSTSSHAADEDPYRSLQIFKEANGLTVVLAPSETAKTFRMKIRVDAGFLSETRANAGVSHLLEHYLFTDARLAEDMSYLEVINEKGGEANGFTSARDTSYYGVVPAEHTKWLVRLMSGMIFGRSFDDDRVEHARKPVLLEIGQPQPLAPLKDSWLYRVFFPDFLDNQGFWQTEFGIREKYFIHEHEQLNTLRLTARDLAAYYHSYYRPSNMTVFLAGKFDVAALRELIHELMGKVADWSGDSMPPLKPVPRRSPYIRTSATTGTPFLSLGAKVWKLSLPDELVLRIYTEYLAHRLMKDLRNKKGETYSARPIVNLRDDFGLAMIRMETPPEKFGKNLSDIRALMKNETEQGQFSKKQFDEAMDLYARHFRLTDRDSGTYLGMADELDRERRVYGSAKSPYLVFRALEYPDFVSRLKALYRPERAYSELEEPPFLGRLERPLLVLIFLMSFFRIARARLRAPFDHAKLRWMRKVSFPPIYLFEAVVLGIALLLSRYFMVARGFLFDRVAFLQSSFLISDYLGDLINLSAALAACVAALSLLKRKLVVSGDTLYLKSPSYMSTRIPLSAIKAIELVNPWRALLSWKRISRIKWRFFYYDPLSWHPGMLLTLKDGRSYFLGMKRPSLAIKELNQIVLDSEKPRVSTSLAA